VKRTTSVKAWVSISSVIQHILNNCTIMKRLSSMIVNIVVLSTLAFGDVIHVPADYVTIQEGLNAAIDGDTVLVADGTYYENISWPTTNDIELIGSGDENCIIDGDSLASVISFNYDLGVIIDSTTLITGFTIQNGGGETGGGIFCWDSSPSLTDVTITGNSVSQVGGGIFFENNSNPTLINVTIANNSSHRAGGGIFCWGSNPSLVNSVLWNDSPQEIYLYEYHDLNSIMIAYSDIQGGENAIETNDNGTVYWEEGNIDLNPMFVDSIDFNLQEGSPCIEAGTAIFVFEDDTLVNMSEDEYIGNAPDMGAFESSYTASVKDKPQLPGKFALHQNYPNPFNPITTITYHLPQSSHVQLAVYNVAGQLVETLLNEHETIGYHSIVWDASSISTGVYFYRIEAGEFSAVKKCIILK